MPGYEVFGQEERDAIVAWFATNNGVMMAHGFDALRRGVFKVREFERAIATTVQVPYAQAVSSGTAALVVALRALGVQPGDEVITQAFTFVATVEAIREVGAIPVITEVDESLTMDPKDFASKITPRTKVVIPVHMAGAAADMVSLLRIARAHRIAVLEDACQAFGGTYHGMSLGTLGDLGVYSFDFAKNITTGEGGMIVTRDQQLYERSRALHDHGHEYHPAFRRGEDTRSLPGLNFRMTEIQGVIGLAQLEKLPDILRLQRAHKSTIKAALAPTGVTYRRLHDAAGDIADTLIFFLESETHARACAAGLAQQGLGTKNLPDALTWHFAGTWQHLFHGIPSLQHPDTLWPHTATLLRRAIALPINVKMSDTEIDRVIAAVRTVLRDVEVTA